MPSTLARPSILTTRDPKLFLFVTMIESLAKMRVSKREMNLAPPQRWMKKCTLAMSPPSSRSTTLTWPGASLGRSEALHSLGVFVKIRTSTSALEEILDRAADTIELSRCFAYENTPNGRR